VESRRATLNRVYTLKDYGRMIADSRRMGAYAEAIQATVRPGDVVLDLGAGSGICALLACKAGASRVYAIETNAAIRIARQVAADNGFAERIVFIEKDSRRVELPEQVDTIVSDLRGVLPIFEANFAIVRDAKARFLKPGGTLIPFRDTLYCAPISTASIDHDLWGPYAARPFGLDFSGAERALRQLVHDDRGDRVTSRDMLAAAQSWATLDYGDADHAAVRGSMRFLMTRAGELDALALWFDAELTGAIAFSNAPGADLVYARALLPLERSVHVLEGQLVDAKVWAHATQDDTVWSWHVAVAGLDFRGTQLNAIRSPRKG
jgi:type I protein arginine methyltransferase